MKPIKNCSLVIIDCYNYGKAVSALQKSMAQNQFEEVLFLTDIKLQLDGIKVVQIPSIKSKEEYSKFVIKELFKYIQTGFILLIQHDGYTLNGDLFDDRLYSYDYAGALWLENDGYANGNGGYSWRSFNLLEATAKDTFIKATNPEDAQICRTYRDFLEQNYGLKWAPDELCEAFSFELREPKQPTMGFHGSFHAPYKPTVILKRSAALGDIILMEPVMRYYYENGYNVVLDIPEEFFQIFQQHYYPLKHISQFDKGRIKAAKEINIDLAYEVKPHQAYLKSYFEFCGVEDYELSRPQLGPIVNDGIKIFKKYAVVHIDRRATEHRNIYDVDWRKVKKHLEALGYTVIQIGKNDHESCGLEFNTASINMMKYVIGGADLFIGVDSGPAHIAIGFNKPCVLFFGSVNPDYVHVDLEGVEVIQGNCDNSYCWHTAGGTSGNLCKYVNTRQHLQCCKSGWEQVIDAINKLHQ